VKRKRKEQINKFLFEIDMSKREVVREREDKIYNSDKLSKKLCYV